MKNKHGFLLGEETVKIIIAIICLAALVYFLASLYLANRNKELEFATASLEKLITDINAGRVETEIYNPKGWGIVSFPSSINQLPEFCLNKGWNNCVCICKFAPNTHFLWDSCLTKGNINMACSQSDFSINVGLGIGIGETLPVYLSINQQSKTITKKE